jgi:cation diffusion facilitator family transporter
MPEALGGEREGVRFAALGLFSNAALAVIKGVAGLVGHSYALIADAIESSADIGSSLVVWGSLRLSSRSADREHPYGHGKAEPLAAATVSLLLAGAAVGIFIKGAEQILSPRRSPAPWTLAVLGAVILVKEFLFRRANRIAGRSGSTVVAADAWHHRSDAITSTAAFVGIAIAVIGGPRWAWSDGAAAIVAGVIILFNASLVLRPAVHELMDGAPDTVLLARVADAATSVTGVQMIEQLKARKLGVRYLVDLHVQADPAMSLHDAHILSGCVKTAIRRAVPAVDNVLVHMEPFEEPSPPIAPGQLP